MTLCHHVHTPIPLNEQLTAVNINNACPREGGGVRSRHMARRSLIGQRDSPDMTALVFCRGNARAAVLYCGKKQAAAFRQEMM